MSLARTPLFISFLGQGRFLGVCISVLLLIKAAPQVIYINLDGAGDFPSCSQFCINVAKWEFFLSQV